MIYYIIIVDLRHSIIIHIIINLEWSMESAVVIDCWSESNSSLAGMRASFVRPHHWRRILRCRHHRIDRSWFHSWRHRIRLHRCRRRCLSRSDHRCSTSASQAFVGTLDDSIGQNSMHPGMKVRSSRCFLLHICCFPLHIRCFPLHIRCFPLHIRTDSILDSPLLYIC